MTSAIQPTVIVLGPPEARESTRTDVLTRLVIAYAALLPFQVEVSKMVRFSVGDLVLMLAILVVPGQIKYRKETWSGWHYGLLALFAVSTLMVATKTGSLEQYVYLNKDAGLLFLFFAYALIASSINGWLRLRRVLRAFVISVVLQNLVGIVAWVASTRFGIDSILVGDNGLRLCGMMGDANAYGGLLICALVICEGASFGRSPLFKTGFLMFSRITLAAGLLVSFSRTAWIALSLVFLCLLFTRFKTAIRALFILLCGSAVTMLVMGRQFLSLFEALAFRHEVATGEGRTRFDLVSTGLEGFSKHPFFGMGIGSFIAQEGTIVHNTAIWFLTEFGLIGVTVFVGFVLWFFWKGRVAYRTTPEREKPVVFGLLLGYVAMGGMAMGIEAFYQRHWWLIFSLIACSYSIARRQRRMRVVYAPVSNDSDSRSA